MTECSNKSSTVTFLSIKDGQVFIDTEGHIRLGRGMSATTLYGLRNRCVELLNNGYPLDAVKVIVEKEAKQIETSIEAINRIIPGRASGWHFLAKCLGECKSGRRASANLHRLINRMIEELDEEAHAYGLRFMAYAGVQEDLAQRIWDVFKYDCPHRYANYKWSPQVVELKCYLAWKLANERTGFPIMPGEEIISEPAKKGSLLASLENLFACCS